MVYDCFTFFNELEILEIRLNTLNNVVDRFVITEATITFQGEPKPLYFLENKEKFAAFADKIIHVIIEKHPENPENAWINERYQRDMMKKGLKQCKPDDVILLSDVDEIPNPEKVIAFKNKKGIKVFNQNMFYYFLNCVATSHAKNKYSWNGSVMLKYSDLDSPQKLRDITMLFQQRLNHSQPLKRLIWKLIYLPKRINYIFIKNGGWHFSYLGGVDRIIKKLESFSHSEYNKPEYKNPEKIKERIHNGDDIFGRDFKYSFIRLDNSFPKYIVDNKEKFKNLIYLG